MFHPILRFTLLKPTESGPKSGDGSLILRCFQKAHVSGYLLIVSFGPAAHTSERGDDCFPH